MLLYVFCFLVLSSVAQEPSPKVVLVIADGIPADVIERLHPPALQSIIDSGKYIRAYVGGHKGTYTETPTISAPGYNDMLTGTWAYKHNVWDNDHQQPNYHYPTLFRLLKTARPTATTAIFSTWVDNRTVLLGAGLKQTANMAIDYVYDGFEKDTVRFPHDPKSFYLHRIDEHVIHCADSVIRANAPDLSWIYLEYTDDVGHARGTGADFDSAVGFLDRQMKKISEAIKFREAHYPEKWLMVITTDHGRDSLTGAGHGGQSVRERTTWMVLNQPVTNAYADSQAVGIVDIVPAACDYLGIHPGTAVARELDGVPLAGPVSISDARMRVSNDSILLAWKAWEQSGDVRIYISYTNHFAAGTPDRYRLLGAAKSSGQFFSCRIAGLSRRPFFKIVVEGKSNTLNIRRSAQHGRL